MSKLFLATLIMTAPLSTIGFAAPSSSIVALVSDSQAVANDLAAVVAGMQQQGQNLTHVTTNLTLPTAGDNGSTITWSSSNAKVVDASGHVVRPHNYQSDAHLTLTATFSKGNVKRTKTFNVTVQKNDKSDADSVAAEQDLLTGQTILASNRSLDAVTGKLNLPTTGDKKTGTTIVWSSNNTDFVSATGAVKRPSYLQDDQHVTLTATISIGETQATKTFDVTVKKLDPVTEAEKLAYARDTLMFASIKGGNADSDHVTTKLNLLKQAANGVKITWSADQAVSPTGVVTRPSYTAGDVDVVLTATLSLSNKSEPVTKTFHLKVLKNTPVTDLERVTADALALTDNTIKKQNGDLSNVTGNLSLQVSGQNRSTITWTSSDAATINPKNGVVTRPSYSAGDKSVDLTATIKMHDSSETKTFHVTVLKAEPNNNAEWVQKTISTLTLGDTSAVTSDLSLPTSAPNGVKIDWVSSNPAVVSKDGKVTRPAYLTGDQTLSLIATVHKGNSSQSKEFSVTVTKLPESKGEAVSIANDAIAAVPDADLITVDTFSDAYEKVQTAHDDIKAATDLGAVDADFVGMDRLVAADAKINGILNQQAVAADVSSLSLQYAGDESASGVKSNIVLPTSGYAGSTITWETSDANVVATDGTVTRPAVGAGNATATLTATISKGAATDTKQFTLTVLERDAVKVQLLSINDLHGKIDQTYQEDYNGDGVKENLGRLDYMQGYFKKLEAQNPNTLVVHSGDATGGSAPVSALFNDEPTVAVLNQMGFATGTVGNHEFDRGTDELKRLVYGGDSPKGFPGYGGMDFPLLAANVVYKDSGKLVLPAYTVKEVGGVKIGFIGVVTQAAAGMVMPAGIQDITFTDETKAVNDAAAELEAQGVHALVVLAHMDATQSGNSITGVAADMANNLDPDVDVILAAHNHKVVNGTVNGKLIVQSYEYGKAFGDVNLDIDPVTGDIVHKKADIVYNDQSKVQPDADTQALIQHYEDMVAPKLNEVEGQAAITMVGGYTNAGDNALGNLIADSMNAEMHSDFAMVNGGGIRDNLTAGDITWNKLFNILPFNNILVTVQVKGSDMFTIINNQLSKIYGPDFSVAGLRYTYNQSTAKVVDIFMPDGSKIDPTKTYTLTVNNFMQTATAFKYSAIGTLGKNPVTGTEDLPALVDFVKNYQGPIAYQADGRIQYANTITATNNAGATDSVFVDKLNANDKVRVYASATATTPLATATVATGQTSVTVNNLDLGANAGTVYVMIVSNGQSTGPMLPITFAAE